MRSNSGESALFIGRNSNIVYSLMIFIVVISINIIIHSMVQYYSSSNGNGDYGSGGKFVGSKFSY